MCPALAVCAHDVTMYAQCTGRQHASCSPLTRKLILCGQHAVVYRATGGGQLLHIRHGVSGTAASLLCDSQHGAQCSDL